MLCCFIFYAHCEPTPHHPVPLALASLSNPGNAVDNESLILPTGDRDRPSFTFVEHKDNLQTKRIKDAGARKAIRSHVMRGEKLNNGWLKV
jgi:hypothetical protein